MATLPISTQRIVSVSQLMVIVRTQFKLPVPPSFTLDRIVLGIFVHKEFRPNKLVGLPSMAFILRYYY